MSPKPGREPVEGWEPYHGGAELYIFDDVTMSVQDLGGEWEAYGDGVNAGPFDTERAAKLFAEDHAFQQLLEAAAQLKPQHRAALERLEKSK